MIARFSLLCAALLALPATYAAVDIVAIAHQEGVITVSNSVISSLGGSYSLTDLLDGKRTVLNKNGISASKPGILTYDIDEDFRSGALIRIESFSYTTGSAGYDFQRYIRQMRLEALPDGADDWVLLADSDAVGDFGKLESTVFTVPVPLERQGYYRHFRFVITEGGTDVNYLTVPKLTLNGRIYEMATQIWSGGENGTWTANGENWTDTNGTASAFVTGSRAKIGCGSLTVDGVATVSSLSFDGAGPQTLSGGTVIMNYPAAISSLSGVRIASEICPGSQVIDTATSCASGVRAVEMSSFLPRRVDGKNDNEGEWVTYWRNRNLSHIAGFSGAMIVKSGESNDKPATASFFVNDGMTASAQFQCLYLSNGKLCLKVEFRQKGPDIEARAVYAKFWWDYPETADFDHTSGNSGSAKIKDDANSDGYGIKGILAIDSDDHGLTLVDEPHRFVRTGWFPQASDNAWTGKTVVYASHATIAGLGGLHHFKEAKFRYNHAGTYPAWPYHIVESADSVTVQFQTDKYLSGVTQCVKLEFRNEGDDVTVRAVYARFTRAHGIGYDFDGETQSVIIEDEAVSSTGYNLTDVYPDDPTSIAFTGAFDPGVCLRASDYDVELGGEALAFDQPFIGTGRLLFTPAHGTQSVLFSGVNEMEGGIVLSGATVVTVSNAAAFAAAPVRIENGAKLVIADGIAATIPEIVFAGDSTIEFGTGASLSVGAVDLTDAGRISVASALGPTTLRIGESATLTKAELKKFWRFGKRFVQDESGYVFEYPAPGFILLFR